MFLGFQGAAIVYARFVPSRYFCWVPFDVQVEYALSVSLHGEPLSAKQIEQRYKIRAHGIQQRALQHTFDILQQYEQTYGRNDDASITMTYRVNGGDPREWHWPLR